MSQHWINTSKITFSGVYLAVIIGLQVALSPLPNIETVTLLLIIGAVHLPLLMVLPIGLCFVTIEMLIYGFGTWFFFYLVVWPLLILGTLVLRPLIRRHWWIAVIWGSLFSFCFGTIDALLKGLLFGTSGLLAYWFQGLMFDLIHGVSNFLIIFCCYLPVAKVVNFYSHKFQTTEHKFYWWRWLMFNWRQSKHKVVQQWNKIVAN